MLSFRRRSDPLLVVVDAVAATAVSYAAFHLRFPGESSVPEAYVDRYRVATVGLALSWVLLARSSGLYRRDALRRGTSNFGAAFLAAGLSGVALVLADFAVLDGLLSLTWIGRVVLGLVLAGLASRAVLRRSPRGH